MCTYIYMIFALGRFIHTYTHMHIPMLNCQCFGAKEGMFLVVIINQLYKMYIP